MRWDAVCASPGGATLWLSVHPCLSSLTTRSVAESGWVKTGPSATPSGRSAPGGEADLIRREADIAAGSPTSAGPSFCPSRGAMRRVSASTAYIMSLKSALISSCRCFGAWASRLRSLCTVQRRTGTSPHRPASAASAAGIGEQFRSAWSPTSTVGCDRASGDAAAILDRGRLPGSLAYTKER